MQLSGKIAFVGGGAMAEAIIKRLVLGGWPSRSRLPCRNRSRPGAIT